MSREMHKANRAYFSPNPPFVLVVVLATLTLAGCNKTSNRPEPGSATSPTVATAQAGLPKLVDLGATQCIPCKMMAPVLEELDEEYAGVMDVEFIDVWLPENKEKAKSYGIEEIPTQIFLDPEGKELWRHVGFIAKADILAKWSEFGYDLKSGKSGDCDIALVADTSPTGQDKVVTAASDSTRISVDITARAAYEKAQKSPKEFHILDIRTPEEYVFIGHPEGVRNIPVMFMGYSYDEKMGRQTMLPNAEFAAEVGQIYSPDDHLAILCESGPRAAMAIRILNKAGFKHLYAITHGFVGEKQGQAGHPDFGKRLVNGWIKEGVPWTTDLVPSLMYQRRKEIAGR